MQKTSTDDIQISIRKARASDIPKLAKISQSASKDSVEKGGMPWRGVTSYSARKKFNEGVLKSQRKKEAVVLVAEADGNVIGRCIIKRNPWKWRSHLGMLDIYIAHGYQSKGIGQSLMRECIKAAKGAWKDLEIVGLEVNGSNKQAIRAYEKFGFKRIAEVPNITKWKRKYYSVVTMHLRVR